MEDPTKKSSRLQLEMRLFAENRQGFKVSELSEQLGVTERTIQRDLEEIQVDPWNLPLYRDGWVWKVDAKQAVPLPPITLNREQAAALFVGARLLNQHSGRISGVAESAVFKLAQALPAEVGKFLQLSGVGMGEQELSPEQVATQQMFSKLVTGWIERRKVVCLHQTLGGVTKSYKLAPYTFEPSAVGYAIYVRGRCDEDPPERLRTLKLERIRQVTLTEERFQPPKDLGEMGFENAWRIWESDEPPVLVHLRFSKRVAKRVRETKWHPSQELTELEDGGCEWRAQVAEPTEMLPWIRGWGAECQVLAPTELRNELVREARKLARLYEVMPAEAAPAKPKVEEGAIENRLRQTFKDFFGE
jgi:predicted DNA-binding transcriptional regulator YafY